MDEAKAEKEDFKWQTEEPCDEERREALKRMGKYAAYTTPVMLALLLPHKCLANSDPCSRTGESCEGP
jgi:hypothetical protein